MQLPVTHLHQGQTNGCGTTALAMALNCLLTMQEKPHAYSRHRLDAGHRAFDCFSAPTMLLSVARKAGFFAQAVSRPAWRDLLAHLRAGHPLLLLYSVDGTARGLHYVLLYGFEGTDSQDGFLWLCDPASSRQSHRRLSYADYRVMLDAPLYWLGWDTGLRPLVLAFSSHDDLPAGQPVHLLLRAAAGINWLLARIERLFGLKFKESDSPAEIIP